MLLFVNAQFGNCNGGAYYTRGHLIGFRGAVGIGLMVAGGRIVSAREDSRRIDPRSGRIPGTALMRGS